MLPAGSKRTAACAADGFLLGNPAFFGFRNKPALLADIAEGARAGDGFPETTEKLLLRFIWS